jgi:hypothetical protein
MGFSYIQRAHKLIFFTKNSKKNSFNHTPPIYRISN